MRNSVIYNVNEQELRPFSTSLRGPESARDPEQVTESPRSQCLSFGVREIAQNRLQSQIFRPQNSKFLFVSFTAELKVLYNVTQLTWSNPLTSGPLDVIGARLVASGLNLDH